MGEQVQVRVTAHTRDQVHRSEWEPAPDRLLGDDEPDDAEVARRMAGRLARRMASGQVLGVAFAGPDGWRFLAGRAVEWVEVEVRRIEASS